MAIFIENFERTENSDEIFGVIGRALVIATRFDSMCKALARAVDLKSQPILRRISENDFNSLVEKVLRRSSTLDKSIQNLGLPNDLSVILHDARKARPPTSDITTWSGYIRPTAADRQLTMNYS